MAKTNQEKKDLKSWLDSLQQESWQLELIISGVVIFLMIGAYEPMGDLKGDIFRETLSGSRVLIGAAIAFIILEIAYYVLLITFIIHLILRGLWIGAVGLRSVSGDFDYEVLDYQPRYRQWLKNHLGSFDDYIERLETQCSVAFSFAFLMFFSVLSVGVFSIAVAGITVGLNWLLNANVPDAPPWKFSFVFAINLVLMLAGLLYLIDFSSLGWFKKQRWLQRVYYPFYRFMGWITLAKFYRPFYYNMIDHAFGRKLVKWLWLIVFGGMLIVSVTVVRQPYFPFDGRDASVIRASQYLDATDEGHGNPNLPSLNSRYAQQDYLEVFVPYLGETHDKVIQHMFPALAPALTGMIAVDGPITLRSALNEKVKNDSLLLAHKAIHRLFLNDSLLTDIDWHFYQHPQREQKGLLYDLPVYDLPRGTHLLRFETYFVDHKDSLYWRPFNELTFVR